MVPPDSLWGCVPGSGDTGSRGTWTSLHINSLETFVGRVTPECLGFLGPEIIGTLSVGSVSGSSFSDVGHSHLRP